MWAPTRRIVRSGSGRGGPRRARAPGTRGPAGSFGPQTNTARERRSAMFAASASAVNGLPPGKVVRGPVTGIIAPPRARASWSNSAGQGQVRSAVRPGQDQGRVGGGGVLEQGAHRGQAHADADQQHPPTLRLVHRHDRRRGPRAGRACPGATARVRVEASPRALTVRRRAPGLGGGRQRVRVRLPPEVAGHDPQADELPRPGTEPVDPAAGDDQRRDARAPPG